ncbi:MATE family efflux transporter [Youxingia wuxianensis]|uniref:Probable multidrug resistance protein NorM n=1 Tax=Youxingia wuxianensis TaxID=2763678 RepID=A0A926EQ57_9FIRM|nr:MATE family efflux transporter [Youxingia wuxianensis]MBC8584632.1 MATE family efflux transporter [Youxingia wuxianensis]
MKQASLTSGNIFSTLIKFAFPFLLANLLQALYGAADLLIVGQLSTSAAVSAVAIGSQVMQTITGITVALTTGGTVLIGQYLGAQQEEDVAHGIGTIIWVFGIMAVSLTILMALCTNIITAIMQTPPQAQQYTCQYIFICSCGILFIVGYNAVSGIMRGLGDSRSPFIFVAIACVVNVFGDLLLVGPMKMGAAGAAIATIAAQAISMTLAIFFLKKRGFPFPFTWRHVRLQAVKAKKIFKLGLPLALQDSMINVSFLMITAIINVMGVTASAAVGVVEKVIIFAMQPASAFSSAIAVITAQNMGAGQTQRAKKSMYLGMGCSLIFGLAFWIYCQFDAALFLRIFSTDPQVIQAGAQYLMSYSFDCVLVSFVFCYNSFFNGCGHSSFPMIHSVFATLAIRIPLVFIVSKIPGITLFAIGLIVIAATAVSLILCIIYMKSGKWKVNTILE